MKIALLLIITFLAVTAIFADTKRDSAVAWNDGWMSSFIDATAIAEYHRRMDRQKPGETPEEIWTDVLKEAKRMEDSWNSLSDKEKSARKITPFWKSGNGAPRRLF